MKTAIPVKFVSLFLTVILSIPVFADDTGNNAYLDKTSAQYSELLAVIEKGFEHPSYTNNNPRLERARTYYSRALNFHKNNDYERAIYNYIKACDDYTFEIVYYQLGLCLMDSGDLETAKKLFEAAILRSGYNYGMEDFLSTDTNGIVRETYFSYYNIACIESLQNNISDSFTYLEKALRRGYPYISHIRNDSDLRNLFQFNNGSYLNRVQEIYDRGAVNTVAGKGYRMAWGGAPLEYHFVDRNRMTALFGSVWPDPGGWISAEYEVRNYIIIVKNIRYHYDETPRFRRERFTILIDKLEGAGFEETPLKGSESIR